MFDSSAARTLQVSGRAGVNVVYLDACYAASFIQVQTFNADPPLFPQNPAQASVTIARCQTLQLIVRTGGNIGVLPEPGAGTPDRVILYGNLVIGPPYSLPSGLGVNQAIYVETGKADDHIDLSYNVTYERLFAQLGDGNDFLQLTGNQATQNATLDGGPGTDTLAEIANFFGSRTVVNFP
jgi:hypothetical protein